MLKSLLTRFATAKGVVIDDAHWRDAVNALPFIGRRDHVEQARLRALAQQFLADKEMAAAGGLELTAAIQVRIAAQACLPVLNLGLHWYRGWRSIVVYPDEFVVPREITDDTGVVHEFSEPIAGEAWDGGPLLLSWADAGDASAHAQGYNVVIHEFTHKLDMLNGDADGLPPFDRTLHPALNPKRWRSVLADALARFAAELDLIESELPATIDPDAPEADAYYQQLPLDAYAAKDESEFFAVSTEAFFVAPESLRQAFPDWYALLAQFFRQDPLQ